MGGHMGEDLEHLKQGAIPAAGPGRGLRPAARWAAAAAGVLWLGSGAVNAALTGPQLSLPSTAVGLLFPGTVPQSAWSGPLPWLLLVPVLSTLLLMALTAVFTSVILPHRVERGRTLATFLALWFGLVLASFFSGLISAAGMVLADWPPERLAYLLARSDLDLAGAGYWGLIWGWVPALAALLVPAASGRAASGTSAGQRPGSTAQGAGITVALAAGLVGVLVLSGQAAQLRDDQALAQALEQQSQPPETPVVFGSPEVSFAVETAGENWCRGDQVLAAVGLPDAATGHRSISVMLTNSGTGPCVLNGYPDLAFDDETGWIMDVNLVRGGSFMTQDSGPQELLLDPGQSAVSALGWRSTAEAGMLRAGTMLVAPYAGTPRQSLPVDLDIVNGTVLTMSAWTAAGS